MENKIENGYNQDQFEDAFLLIKEVLKGWWMILCVAISAAFLAYILSAMTYHPTFTSKTTFIVSTKSSTTGAYGSSSKVEQLTTAFSSIMDSQILKKKAAEAQGYQRFNGQVKIDIVPNTNLLTLSVSSTTPDQAFRLLEGMLEHYETVGHGILGDVVLDVFEEPAFPTRPDSYFNGTSVMKKAFVIAAAVMMALIALLYYQKDTIKKESDIEKKLDIKRIGTIEHEGAYRSLQAALKRHKKKMLLSDPTVSFSFSETIKKIVTKISYYCGENRQMILVTSVHNKEGKTLTAANLAIGLAQRNKKVLLIEGDLKKSGLKEMLNLEISEEILALPNDVGGLIRKSVKRMNSSLYVLPNEVLKGVSRDFIGSDVMKAYLKRMRQNVDYIIVDGPNIKNHADAELWASYSNYSILVVKQDFAKIADLNQVLDILNGYGQGVLGCIFNDVLYGTEIARSGYGYGYGYGYGRYRYGKYGYGKYGYGRYSHHYYHTHHAGKDDANKEVK